MRATIQQADGKVRRMEIEVVVVGSGKWRVKWRMMVMMRMMMMMEARNEARSDDEDECKVG